MTFSRSVTYKVQRTGVTRRVNENRFVGIEQKLEDFAQSFHRTVGHAQIVAIEIDRAMIANLQLLEPLQEIGLPRSRDACVDCRVRVRSAQTQAWASIARLWASSTRPVRSSCCLYEEGVRAKSSDATLQESDRGFLEGKHRWIGTSRRKADGGRR